MDIRILTECARIEEVSVVITPVLPDGRYPLIIETYLGNENIELGAVVDVDKITVSIYSIKLTTSFFYQFGIRNEYQESQLLLKHYLMPLLVKSGVIERLKSGLAEPGDSYTIDTQKEEPKIKKLKRVDLRGCFKSR